MLDRTLFVISNLDYPNLLLQPGQRALESAVILGHAGTTGIVGANPNAWKVTSPLLSDSVLTTIVS